MKLSTVFLSLAVFLGSSATTLAAEGHTDHAGHSMSQTAGETMVHSTSLPTQGGQAAFSTIAEIVALLNQDTNTDWSKVDINRLREHLVDMNELTLNAKVEQSSGMNFVKFIITGQGRTLQAIKAMVPAHAAELNKLGIWHIEVKVENDKAIMQVMSHDKATLAKISALGFFGVMATGAHHQAHHWGMATGKLMEH